MSYFPYGAVPEYNQYSDDDSEMVRRAKYEAMMRQANSQPHFQQGLDVGGYQLGQPSNQQETLQKLNAYSNWANQAGQQQQQLQQTKSPWDGIAKIGDALAQKYGGQGQNLGGDQLQAFQDMGNQNQMQAGLASARNGGQYSFEQSPFIDMLMKYLRGGA
jgi:hypothetical protein